MTLSTVPKFNDKSEDVKKLQAALKEKGFDPGSIDGWFFDKTREALRKFQKSIGLVGTGVMPSDGGKTFIGLGLTLEPVKSPKSPIWLDEAKKHTGKKESDSTFNKYMSAFWGKVGLPQYKTIVGTSFAWCGLFVAAMLINVGAPWQKDGAGAKNWAKYGQAIDFKKNGIPKGAIVHINNAGKCGSGSSNHVAFANGDCTAEHLLKSGATLDLFGGNQSNQAKVSTFSASKVCAVRYPKEITENGNVIPIPLPGKVLKNVNCTSGKDGKESTR